MKDKMASEKLEIVNPFDSLIQQVMVDLKCNKSYKTKGLEKRNSIEYIDLDESSLNESYEIEEPWLELANNNENRCLKSIICTETYKKSIVRSCVREVLKDGEETVYLPFARKMSDMALKKSGKAVAKQQTSCRHCGRLFEASRGIKIHENRCKNSPKSTKTKR